MTDRVGVYIDGQNLFKAVNRRYRTRVHPMLLGRELAGDRSLVGVHYYSGIHDRSENAEMHELVRRRHDLMSRTGVQVHERVLRYHWEWRVTGRLPPPWDDDGPDRLRADVVRHRGAREKGVDVALALDAVTAAVTGEVDVVVVVSRDRDLMEIADEIDARCEAGQRRVEVAYVEERAGDGAPRLPAYGAITEIDEAMVDRCRDDFDYRRTLPSTQVEAFLAAVGSAGATGHRHT